MAEPYLEYKGEQFVYNTVKMVTIGMTEDKYNAIQAIISEYKNNPKYHRWTLKHILTLLEEVLQ